MPDQTAIQEFVFSRLTKGDRTRLRILEAAIECFAEQGFEGASFTELSLKAKASRGHLTHYFASKETLVAETFKYVLHVGQSTSRAYMAHLKEPEDPIQRYVEAHVLWFQKHPAHARYLILCLQRASYDPKMAKAIRSFYEPAWEGLTKTISTGMRDGKYRKNDPAAIARAVHSLVVGTLVLCSVHPRILLEDLRKSCLVAVVSMLAASRPEVVR